MQKYNHGEKLLERIEEKDQECIHIINIKNALNDANS